MIKASRALYGHTIEEGINGALTDQVYSILLREILSGRWSVGERLPSYSDLAKMSGISRYPMEVAIGRLAKEGYLEKIRKKGVFLKSTSVDGRIGTGLITLIYHSGLPNSEEDLVYTQTFGTVSIAGLMGEFTRHGFSLEVIDLAGANRKVNDGAKGIVSLAGYDVLHSAGIDVLNLPVVYLGMDDIKSVPCIAGDPAFAMHMLTTEVIRRGHTRIAVFAPHDWEPESLKRSLDAHRMAMEAADLPVAEELIEMSCGFEAIDLPAIKSFLNNLDGQTVLICMKAYIVQQVYELARVLEIDIPSDLSLTSLQATRRDEFFATTYDWTEVYRLCSELLERDDRSSLSRFTMKPFTVEGVTLAAMQ